MPSFPPKRIKLVREAAECIIFRYAREDENSQRVIHKSKVLVHLTRYFKEKFTGSGRPSHNQVLQIFKHKIVKPAEAGTKTEKIFGMIVEEKQLYLKKKQKSSHCQEYDV